VANRVVEAAAGRRVCVVASAMGDTTDELLGLPKRSRHFRRRASWTCS
jgi:aspartokinase